MKGQGTVYKRGDTYAVSYYTGLKKDGKYIRKTKSGFLTKRAAKKYLNERIEEIHQGVNIVGADVLMKHYLPEWLDSYSQSVKLAKNTYRGYKVNIDKHIIPVIGDIKLIELQPYDIDRVFQNMTEKKLSITSQRYVIATLRKSINTAIKRRILNVNVISLVDIPKPVKYNAKVLTKDEMTVLCNECLVNFDYMPILVGLSLGLRRGEVLGLKWSDFDFDKSTVFIQRTATPRNGGYDFSDCKTQNSRRLLLLPDFLCEYLLKWKDEQNILFDDKSINSDNFVCALSRGIISATTLYRRYKGLLKKCNLPNIRFHDLRHSWATLMLSSNVPTKIASAMLGHSSAQTTLEIYSHVLPEAQQLAIDAINSVLQ